MSDAQTVGLRLSGNVLMTVRTCDSHRTGPGGKGWLLGDYHCGGGLGLLYHGGVGGFILVSMGGWGH